MIQKQLIQWLKPLVERFPRLAMAYRYVRDTWHFYDNPHETPLGFKFVGNPLMQQGLYEPDETRLVRQIMPVVDVVINIGANIGYYCCLALSCGKPVIAFEPMEANLKLLLLNVHLNQWDSQIEVFPLALSDKTGLVEFYGGGPQASLVKGWGGKAQQYVTLVPTSTLDGVLSSRLYGKQCFMLVDIEGAEMSMLHGASCFLDMRPKPIWMMEIAIAEHQPIGVPVNPNLLPTFQLFWDHGYEAWTSNRFHRMISREEREQIVDQGVSYFQTHNFLFIETGKALSLASVW